MKLTSLYSGSSGNCLLLVQNETKLLIDAGLSGSKIQAMLKIAGVEPCELSAILITHEHNDHISGAGILSRRFDLPVYANERTMAAMRSCLGKVKEENLRVFENRAPFFIGDVEIRPFCSCHDAADPVGYRFNDGKSALAVATDIGVVTEEIAQNLLGCKAVFLEANHDVQMLKTGSYPYYLKQRILSDHGHLSNESAGDFCCALIQRGAEKIVLGHLSQHNNTPLTALNTVIEIAAENGMKRGRDFLLGVASRDGISEEELIV